MTFKSIFENVRAKANYLKNKFKENVSAIPKKFHMEIKTINDFRETLKAVSESAEKITKVVQNLEQKVNVFLDELDIKSIKTSTEDVANSIQHLERKIDSSLNKVDGVVQNIGNPIKTILDIAIVLLCLAVVFVCETIDDMVREEPLSHAILILLEVISFISAAAILFRVCFLCIFENVKVENVYLSIPRLIYKFLYGSGAMIYFFIFVAIDCPIGWTWRAYKYTSEMKSRKELLIIMTLQWTTVLLSLTVYYLFLDESGSNGKEALLKSVLTCYCHFYASAVYMYMYHQKPETYDRIYKFEREGMYTYVFALILPFRLHEYLFMFIYLYQRYHIQNHLTNS